MSIAGGCIIGNPPAAGGVQSVNGDTGPNVVLDAADVGAATPADVLDEQQRAELAEQANAQAITDLAAKVYSNIEFSRKGKTADNNYLRYDEVEAKPGQGPSWSNDYSIKNIAWSMKDDDLADGVVEFFVGTTSLGSVNINADTLGQATGTINNPGITFPANQQISPQYQGARISELVLNIQADEV